IRNIVEPEKIDYLIVNHVEMDHSGSFPEIVKLLKNARIVATKEGKEELLKHHGKDYDITVVEDGDTISLGNKTLRFIKTPMLHWPDSMMTYVQEDKVIFTSDAFGQHYASTERFDDELDEKTLYDAAGEYYSNILWLYSPLVSRLIEKVMDMGIKLEMVAPDHGIIWRNDPHKPINWYCEWANGKSVNKVLLVYETMWGSTEKMARAIAKGITDQGMNVKLMKLKETEYSYVIKELLGCRGILVGTPTLNNNMFPSMGGFLTYLKGLRPKGRIGATFGSYGWGGGACKAAEEMLDEAGVRIAFPPLELKWVPTAEELEDCYTFGKEFASKAMEKI
ncbi:MAG TPA: FprA family A-type flavoprotein, partial [Candidatus Methanofastidiosa archaeon]|nr:FprA family A-type flavoprotein [Candidatus Methanofastidiosa archaeon]